MKTHIEIYSIDAPAEAYVGDPVDVKVYVVATQALPVYSRVSLQYDSSLNDSIAWVSPAWRFTLSIPAMPNKSLSLVVNAYYWNSDTSSWLLDDTQTLTITLSPTLNHELDIWTPIVSMLSMIMVIGMMAMMARGMAGGMKEM